MTTRWCARVFARLLEKLPGVEVVGEASDGREVLKLVKTQWPNVVLMDISMPGLNGLEAAARMAKEFPDVRVLILSMHNNEEYFWRALKAGAAGYLLKKSATAELETALQRVATGKFISAGKSPRDSRKNFPCRESPTGKARSKS